MKKKILNLIVRLYGLVKLKCSRRPPMVIVMVDGGLCSVITKYVLGECFRKHCGVDVKYDLSWFYENGMDCDNKHARELTFPSLFPWADFKEASKDEIGFYKRYFYFKNRFAYKYNASLFSVRRPLYFDGYSENWQYFSDVEGVCLENINMSGFKLNEDNQDVLNDISQHRASVAVHVRRGDYVALGLCTLGSEYYLAAIDKVSSLVREDIKVFFFSDDIGWVKDELANKLSDSLSFRCVDVNGVENGHLDLMLISNCKHQISSNSSFGYWGGLLNSNPSKIVIIPEIWISGADGRSAFEGSNDAHSYPGFIKLKA